MGRRRRWFQDGSHHHHLLTVVNNSQLFASHVQASILNILVLVRESITDVIITREENNLRLVSLQTRPITTITSSVNTPFSPWLSSSSFSGEKRAGPNRVLTLGTWLSYRVSCLEDDEDDDATNQAWLFCPLPPPRPFHVTVIVVVVCVSVTEEKEEWDRV